MRTLVKGVVWFAVFAGAAGVGAYIAAHSEPFPPTADPGNSFNSPTPPSAPAPMWRVVMTSATRHDPIYVAGFTSIPQWCTTRWRSTFTFTIDPDMGAL